MTMSSESTQPQAPLKGGPAAARSFGRAANWTVGVAAAVLVLISVGGYFYHRERLSAIAADHLRLIVTGPSYLQAGVAAEYMVSTTAISGQPLSAQIEVAILGPDGKRLKAYQEAADDRGRLQVPIPADLHLPPQAKLKVMAWYRDSREEVEMPLVVEPVRYITQLASDKPFYKPGETVFYRSLTLSQFALAADRDLPRPLRHSRLRRVARAKFIARSGCPARGRQRGLCHSPEIGRGAVHAAGSRFRCASVFRTTQGRTQFVDSQRLPLIIREARRPGRVKRAGQPALPDRGQDRRDVLP